MDSNILCMIDRMVHELYMVDIHRELLEQCEMAKRCRIWVETMMFTRNWTILLQRHIIYKVILSASLNPVHRKCYDRLVFLTKMTFTFHILTTQTPIFFKYDFTPILPILLL